MDFGLNIDFKKEREAGFIMARNPKGNEIPLLLREDEKGDFFVPPQQGERPAKVARPALWTSARDTLKTYNRKWVPLPYLRLHPDGSFAIGPTNWCRARVHILDKPEEGGNAIRLTVAFDTELLPASSTGPYVAPSDDDIENGHVFNFAGTASEAALFAALPWVDQWIDRLYLESFRDRRGLLPDEGDMRETRKLWPREHVARYLHFLHILGRGFLLPQIKPVSDGRSGRHPNVPVDLILDVGNSRTCSILLERHPDQPDNLTNSYTLELRDLGEPHLTYSEPFESRVEFTLPDFGPNVFSRDSGRNDAFVWPTMARVGPEAARLAKRRRGTEGSTGLSSPKRYLWDTNAYPLDWRFNQVDSDERIEPLANEGRFVGLVNEAGDALHVLDPEDPANLPILNPRYSRSSLMTFAIAEIVTQALMAINSPAQRLRMANSDLPRHLHRIIMTLPPAMSLPEQEILRKRADEACQLVWLAMGYAPEGAASLQQDVWPPVPEVVLKWDEATSAQIVWLYSSIVTHFGGDAQTFFKTIRHPGQDNYGGGQLRVASIDIGGGTTDLVVTDYRLEGTGNNVSIFPDQLFREGFNIAGDDILKRLIQTQVIGPIEALMKSAGILDPAAVTRELLGADRANEDVRVRTLRRQFTSQVLVPIGLALLNAYESYEPDARPAMEQRPFARFFTDQPSAGVLEFLNAEARRQGGAGFDLGAISIPIDLAAIHHVVTHGTEMHRVLEALCEVVNSFNCDVLIVTGRPSRLPGIRSVIRSNLPLPSDRVVFLHGFRTGAWYPFHRFQRIEDPKTTAAVGAMLCLMSNGDLPNFSFRSDLLRLKSTARYIGMVNGVEQITDNDVFYRDVALDNPDYELSEAKFEFRGPMRLGFRQLPIARWRATRLYVLDYEDDATKHRLHPRTPLRVQIARDTKNVERRRASERFIVSEFTAADGEQTYRRGLRLKLQTLDSQSGYWLDTGHVKES